MASFNRMMRVRADTVIGFPRSVQHYAVTRTNIFPKTTRIDIPSTKYSRCGAECEGEKYALFEDSVDFRSYDPRLFNHKVKLPVDTHSHL